MTNKQLFGLSACLIGILISLAVAFYNIGNIEIETVEYKFISKWKQECNSVLLNQTIADAMKDGKISMKEYGWIRYDYLRIRHQQAKNNLMEN